MEYIAEKYGGDNIIAQICNNKKAFSLAAADLLGSPKENNWLSKFYEYVTTSARYKEFSDNFFIENSHVKTQIDLGFNAKTFTNDYNALSAKWHHLELATNLTENTKLKFNTSVPTSGISIIKYNHTSFESREVLQSGYGAVTVSGIKQLAANGYNLFAIVTNNEYDPPNGVTSITLKIEKTDELKITGCSLSLRYLIADFVREYPNGTTEDLKDYSLGMGFPKDDPNATVIFSGTKLTQEYTNYHHSDNYYYSGKISLTFSENMDYVSSFSAEWKRAKDLNSEKHTFENRLSAITIPLDKSVDYLRFKLSGNELCNGKIQSISKIENYGTYTDRLLESTYKCTDNSELVIYISTQ